MKFAFDIFLAGYVLAIAWGISRRNDIELLPSIAWLALMILPFWVQFDAFAETSRAVQGFAVVFVGACLLIADSLPAKLLGDVGARSTAATGGWLGDFRVYGVFLIAVAVYHLSLLDHIPLLEKYIHHVDDSRALSWMREQTSKLLPVHSLTKYVFTWAVNIAAPLAIVLAWTAGRRILAVALLGFAVMYAAMSLAKVPLFILGITILVAFWQRVAFRRRMAGYVAMLFLLLPVAWDAYSFFGTHPYSVFNYRASPEAIAAMKVPGDDPRARLTLGDHARLMPFEADSELHGRERAYNYYTYRVFLSPVDVSSRWYQYFPAVSGRYIGFQGLTPADRERPAETHPARLVGAWAYGARFPQKYLETAQAYASVDADAYARYGVLGIVGVGFAVLALRLLLRRLETADVLGRTLYAIAVALLALLWPMASLQAVLLSNGVAVIIGLMLLTNLQERWLRRLAAIPEPKSRATDS